MAVQPRKRLGQHFLHDPVVVAKIVAAISPRRDDAMVEIGGGTGALTRRLLEHVDRLHVIEIDERLAALLEESVPGRERLVIHRADALRFDYASLASGPRSLRVVGNLPYNISTPLLFRLLEHREWIADMHLMLQREVVDRLTAAPGGKEYGRLTVMFGLWAESQACFDIGPGAFSPPPKVWSTLVRIVPRTAPAVPVADERRFAEVVARLFSMRRKTIGRALKGVLAPERIAAAGLDPMARPETLAPADFARLADLLA
ncbi:MAG TPA: 16S rRNA (adenine(1518)-N(6)/adenine(1519)-N(6))-dimethyltransferase RsmA [Gammaproteobacteria bacterium]